MVQIKSLAKQTAVYGTTTILGRLLNYLLVPLHTYIFTNPSVYGVVGEMYAWVALLLVLLTYGMETAFFRFSEMETDKDRVFGSTLTLLIITSSLFIFLGLIFSQPVADILHYSNHAEYIRWFVIIVGLDAVSTIPFARLRANNKPYLFAGIKITNILILVFFNVFFLWFCPFMIKHQIGTVFFSAIYNPAIGVGYIFIANLIASILQMVLLFFTCKRFTLCLDRRLLKKMLVYALPLLILGLAGIINETIDRIMIKGLSSPDTNVAMYNLGVYSACFKIAVIMNLFIQAFRYSAEPFFFSLYKQKDAKQGYAVVMTYFVIACTFIFLATMMYIDFVKYFVSKNYHEGLSIVPVLLFAYMLLGICFNLSIWYKLTGKTKYGAYITMGGAVVTLLVNWILIPITGYIGAAWGHLITYAIMVIASYLIGQKFYPVSYDLKKISFYLITALALFALTYFIIPFDIFGEHSFTVKIIINTIILFSYAGIVIKKEFKTIKSIL
ncbi:MAG: oligosaccharide flippase family protein [Bacteroidales bacterium]|jgi:O-antigen/teichoic acid export membrane protein|nr:oligosaccharide flippase family protein [Bacteroidales bacterium]